jgi:hypothetical protein
MNAAGILAYANLRNGRVDSDSVRQVIDELELPYVPLPTEREASVLADRTPPIPVMTLPEMLETGRVGLITMDDYSYRRSTESFRRLDVPDGGVWPEVDTWLPEVDTWLEALKVPDGPWLIAPQVRTEVAGIYFIVPEAQGPGLTRLVTFDTGIRAEGGPERMSNVPEQCGRGVDSELNWICLPGPCAGRCEPGWKAGSGAAEISACPCL